MNIGTERSFSADDAIATVVSPAAMSMPASPRSKKAQARGTRRRADIDIGAERSFSADSCRSIRPDRSDRRFQRERGYRGADDSADRAGLARDPHRNSIIRLCLVAWR